MTIRIQGESAHSALITSIQLATRGQGDIQIQNLPGLIVAEIKALRVSLVVMYRWFAERMTVVASLAGESREPVLLGQAKLEEARIQDWMALTLTRGMELVKNDRTPSTEERNNLFEQAKQGLKEFIRKANREDKTVAPNVIGVKAVYKFELPIAEGVVRFKLHADSQLDSLERFINEATPDNACVVVGKSGGRRLGLNGQSIDGLYCYVV